MTAPAAATAPTRIDALRALGARQTLLAGSVLAIAVAAHRDVPLLAIGLAFAVACFLRPARLEDPRWWLAVAAASFAVDATRFLELDDHTVLAHYWALAVGLSLYADDPDRSLELNGRLLIGLTMAFAVASKVAWDEFVDGSFFEATLLLDDRFTWPAKLAGIADPAANQAAYAELAAGRPAELATGPRVGLFATALTAGTLLLEGALAIAYLLPLRPPAALRRWMLVAFCVATYAMVPVAAFGGVLLVMAAADRSCDLRSRRRFVAGTFGLYAWGVLWVLLQ